jgi:pentapeptide repeat protein
MKQQRSPKTSTAPGTRRSTGKPVFYGNEKHLQTLKESLRRRTPHFWNQWREQHPRVVPDLRGLVLAGGFLRGFNLRRARLDDATLVRADLAGVHLEGASFKGAYLTSAELSSIHAEKVNLSGAHCRGATLSQGDFRRAICLDGTYLAHANLREANFTGARMIEATLSQADLTRACFDGADLTEASLSDAILDETSFLGTKLQGTHVVGTFIRRVKTDDRTDQRGLFVDVHVAWERRPGEMIKFTEANDIRVAQFHNIVDEPGSVGKLLAATTKRVVLILGRFLPRRKRVLDRLAKALGERGKIAVIFDFPSPEDREVSDTVRFIAGMAEFIVVDLTRASSVPLELQATIPDLMIPVIPVIQSGHPVFSMFSDLQRRYFWIQPTVSYKDADQLVRYVDDAIIARAESAAEQIKKRRAVSVRAPVSVARANQKARKRK